MTYKDEKYYNSLMDGSITPDKKNTTAASTSKPSNTANTNTGLKSLDVDTMSMASPYVGSNISNSFANIMKNAEQNIVNSATNFVQQAPKNNNNYRYVSAGGGANPNQQYIDQLQDIYNQIMDRGPFAYDLEGDMFFRQYADQYGQLGQQAMRDTMAQSAALTGGYGNSWASAAAQQANQQYLNQLNSMIPEFYDRAYKAWTNEGDELMNQYKLAASHPGVIDSLKPRGGGYTSRATSDAKANEDIDVKSTSNPIFEYVGSGAKLNPATITGAPAIDLDEYIKAVQKIQNK